MEPSFEPNIPCYQTSTYLIGRNFFGPYNYIYKYTRKFKYL